MTNAASAHFTAPPAHPDPANRHLNPRFRIPLWPDATTPLIEKLEDCSVRGKLLDQRQYDHQRCFRRSHPLEPQNETHRSST